jgi:hypothetical protein
MPLEWGKQTSLLLLLTILLGLMMCRANAGLRGDLQEMKATPDSNNNNNNNSTSSNVDKINMWMKSEKAATISMDLSKSWKSYEVKIDAHGSIDTGSGFNSGAIGANHGVFNSLVGTSSDNDANAAFKRRTPMASLHVYIPKNEGNEEPPPRKEEQKKSAWYGWSWS